jgi:hypothetical protein
MLMLPCPFCGQQPDYNDPDCIYPVVRDRTIWRAGCIECAGGCGAEVLGDTAEHAVDKWNTRQIFLYHK